MILTTANQLSSNRTAKQEETSVGILQRNALSKLEVGNGDMWQWFGQHQDRGAAGREHELQEIETTLRNSDTGSPWMQ